MTERIYWFVFFLETPAVTAYSNPSEPYDHGKDTEVFYNLTKDFKEGMKKDQSVVNDYDVKMINKVILRQF